MTTIEINPVGVDIIESDMAQLRDNDFDNNLSFNIYKEDMVVMFYKDKLLLDLWSTISKQVVGVKFGVCDLVTEKNISLSLSNIQDVFPSCDITKFPLILSYNNGHPISFYNNKFESDLIIEYTLCIDKNKLDYSDVLLTGVRMARPTPQVISVTSESEKVINNYTPIKFRR